MPEGKRARTRQSFKRRRHSFKGRKRTVFPTKRRSFKRRHSYKRKRVLPSPRVRKTGSLRVSMSSKNHPRKLFQLFESRCNGSVPIASDTSPVAGVCNTLAFIATNNFSGTSFTAAGANALGLPTTLATNRVAYGSPDGMFTLLYDRFYQAQVHASEVTVSISRTGSSSTASDGAIMFALTPVNGYEAGSIFTNTPPATSYLPSWASAANQNWEGANGAQQWQNCINSPGTKWKLMSFAATTSRPTVLKMRINESFFNTEPVWQSNPVYTTTNSAPLVFTPVTVQNYYVLTYYISAGFSTSTGQQIDITLHNKWWVRGFMPVDSLTVGRLEKDRNAAKVVECLRTSEEEADLSEALHRSVLVGSPGPETRPKAEVKGCGTPSMIAPRRR